MTPLGATPRSLLQVGSRVPCNQNFKRKQKQHGFDITYKNATHIFIQVFVLMEQVFATYNQFVAPKEFFPSSFRLQDRNGLTE